MEPQHRPAVVKQEAVRVVAIGDRLLMSALLMPSRRFRPILWLAIAVLMTVALAACGESEPTATPTPTKTPTPVGVELAQQSSTTTPQPLPVPTATPTPLPLPTPELAPAGPVNVIQFDPLPDNVSPFTGLVVSDPSVLQRMPAAVKVSNSPIVRPQSGLSRADIVIEHLAEGGITRFTAIYQSQDAERIGSVRSARLIDLEIPVLFDTFLVYSAASGEVTRLLDNSDFAEYTLSDWRGDPGFYRLEIPGRAYEHTLFTDTQLLWQVAAERGWNRRPRYRGWWTWSEALPEDVRPARTIDIPYSHEYSDVHYEYDPEAGAYRRWVLGEPHLEELTGEQLATPNVVVVYANHVKTLIVEDVLGSKSLEIQLWGRGRMQLFRDGVVKEGIWLREKREDPLQFVDGNFDLIPFKPGPVWIEVVPLDMEIQIGQ